MAEKTLVARVAPDVAAADVLVVSSPAVGRVEGVPRVGLCLNPFGKLLTMRILNERYTVRLPRDVQGRVLEVCIPDALTPVAFGDRLLKLSTRALEVETDPAAAATAGGAQEAGARAEIAVLSPSVGLFYRRSSPDAEPYVEVGSAVTVGTLLGLVEVMKCFNQITYGGADLPDHGTVTGILAEDGAEVQFGQPLFHIRPLPHP
jgi:biotin carboxyl carrier protein